MNEAIILQIVKPYNKDGSIKYEDFNKIFAFLSGEERNQIIELLHLHDIEIIHNNEEPEEILASLDESSDNFQILYNMGIFKDRDFDNSERECELRHDIKQSNEILCKLIQDGNLQAKQDLCIKNKKLVCKYAEKYAKWAGNALDVEDLEQVGYEGLIKAAEKFDITIGTSFSTYAVYWIKQIISRTINDIGFVIRLPVHLIEQIKKITRLDNQYDLEGIEYKERMQMISDKLNIPINTIKYYLMLRSNFLSCSSLNIPVGEEKECELIEFIPDEETPLIEEIISRKHLMLQVKEVLKTLTPREERIIKFRFGIDDGRPRTLEEIGKVFNVTRERIRQIEAKAVRKLRHPSRSKKLKDYYL